MEALKTEFIPIEGYLESEEQSQIRHEYVDGVVFAMAGANREHELIAGNLFSPVHAHLRDEPCQAFIGNLKVRPPVVGRQIFYYPDLMVTCDPRDNDPDFNRFPKLLVEVLSESTHRTDRIEKLNACVQIPTLEEYVLISQTRPEVIVFRRNADWKPDLVAGLEKDLHLRSIGLSIPLSELYRGVSF
jgi:Uma2 family endonuclease